MLVNQLASDLIDTLLIELKKKNTMNKIQNDILDPIVNHAFRKWYPYMIITGILFFFIFVISLCILVYAFSIDISMNETSILNDKARIFLRSRP